MTTTTTPRTMSFTDRFGHKTSLPYVVESTAPTVMVLGTYLGASVIVLGADSYDSAFEAGLSYMADAGWLATADEPTDPDDTEGMDWVDGHGYMVTADIIAWHLIGLD
jgi:hypothetical protein